MSLLLHTVWFVNNSQICGLQTILWRFQTFCADFSLVDERAHHWLSLAVGGVGALSQAVCAPKSFLPLKFGLKTIEKLA